jgi:hypothetical protein
MFEKLINYINNNTRSGKLYYHDDLVYPPVIKNELGIFYNRLPLQLQKLCRDIEQKLAVKDLSAFHHNIKNLKVTNKIGMLSRDMEINRNSYAGLYFPEENRIYLSPSYSYLHLTHEMLHLASSRISGTTVFCGFNQIQRNSGYSIGRGLNEGYTELLNNRYFNNNRLYTDSYILEQAFAHGIENLVGHYRMEDLYFKSNLKGLADQLSRYYTYEEFEHLVVSLDVISSACISGRNRFKSDVLDNSLLCANRLLKRGLEQKVKESGDNPEIMNKSRNLLKKTLIGSINLSIKDSETYDELMLMLNDVNYMVPQKSSAYRLTRRY